jgi:hypothetical protein
MSRDRNYTVSILEEHLLLGHQAHGLLLPSSTSPEQSHVTELLDLVWRFGMSIVPCDKLVNAPGLGKRTCMPYVSVFRTIIWIWHIV